VSGRHHGARVKEARMNVQHEFSSEEVVVT